MIREDEVNAAMIQQAAEELEIGVPIRAWRVDGGELVLILAYGGEARWGSAVHGDEDDRGLAGAPWLFVAANRRRNTVAIPDGDLARLRKQTLLNMALAYGFQSSSDYVRKDELVEALAWLREQEAMNDGDQ